MRRVSLAFSVAVILAAASASALDVVGKAAAVRRDAKGTPPGQGERTLVGGLEIYGKERVVTSPTGDLQVLFNDESTLTVGPGADMVLDEFVFDPTRTEKALSIKLRRGVTRLIGGKVTKDAGAEIGTPNATIAIRGGILIVSAPGDEGGETRGLLGLGTMTCTGGGDSVVVTVPGMMCVVGRTIQVRRAAKDEIAALLAALLGSGPLDPPFDGKDVEKRLAIDCGGEASLNDPRCIAERGFAGVDPEPLGQPNLAQRLADLFDQLQDVPGSRGSPSETAERICNACR
jgi:hypothetical protein